LPAISPEALTAKGAELRRMRIHRRADLSLDDVARWLKPIVAGWINYEGRFYRTALDPLKHKRLRTEALPRVVDRAARKAALTVHPLAPGPHVPRLIGRAR
jgi:Group II intron, maturase-specific domain